MHTISISAECSRKYSLVILAIVLMGDSFSSAQDISYEKRDYEISQCSCAGGICGMGVPSEWFHVKYEDSNTQVKKLNQQIPVLNFKEASRYVAEGYDLECPFSVNSENFCQAINPVSIYQLHFPQEWPTPLDEYLESVIPLPQVFYSIDWQKIPIKSSSIMRRQLRVKELFALMAKYDQMKNNSRFTRIKVLLQTYGANFAPLHPTFWKAEYKRGF